MASVFRKLISKELGEKQYHRYFNIYQKKIMERSYDHKILKNEEIYQEMYENLKDNDKVHLQKRMERLSEAMLTALRISRTYVFALVFYLMATLFLISLRLEVLVTVGGLIGMSCCFIYKTYEFVVNKFCYIDAHIILVYKSVLDELLKKRGEKYI